MCVASRGRSLHTLLRASWHRYDRSQRMRNLRSIALAAACIVMLGAGSASAQQEPPDLPPTPSPPPAGEPGHVTTVSDRVWFGYELLLMDAAALGGGLLVGSANDGSDWQRTGDVIASAWGLGMVGGFAVH